MSDSFSSMNCSMPGSPVLHCLPEFAQIHVHWVTDMVMPSNHLILCLSLLLLPSIFPSTRVFSSESAVCIRWPKYWNFSFSISLSNIQGWFPLKFTGLIFLLSKGLSRVFSNTTIPKLKFSVVPFSSCPQSFPASGSFQMSQLFASGGQSIGVSASTSVLPMNIQDWFNLGWTGWISLQPKGLSRGFSNTTVQNHQFFSAQLSSQSNFHIHTWPLETP